MTRKNKRRQRTTTHTSQPKPPSSTQIQNQLTGLLNNHNFSKARQLINEANLIHTLKAAYQLQIELAVFRQQLRQGNLNEALNTLEDISTTHHASLNIPYQQLIHALDGSESTTFMKRLTQKTAYDQALQKALKQQLTIIYAQKQQPVYDSLAANRFITAKNQLANLSLPKQQHTKLQSDIEIQQATYTQTIAQLINQNKLQQAHQQFKAAELPQQIQDSLMQQLRIATIKHLNTQINHLTIETTIHITHEIQKAPLYKDQKERLKNQLKEKARTCTAVTAKLINKMNCSELDTTYQAMQRNPNFSTHQMTHLLNTLYKQVCQQIELYIYSNSLPQAVDPIKTWCDRLPDASRKDIQQALCRQLKPFIRDALISKDIDQLKEYFGYATVLDNPICKQLLLDTLEQPVFAAIDAADYDYASQLQSLTGHAGVGINAWQEEIKNRQAMDKRLNEAFNSTHGDFKQLESLFNQLIVTNSFNNAPNRAHQLFIKKFISYASNKIKNNENFEALQQTIDTLRPELRDPLQKILDDTCESHINQADMALSCGDFSQFKYIKGSFTWRKQDADELSELVSDLLNRHIENQLYEQADELAECLLAPQEKNEALNRISNHRKTFLSRYRQAIKDGNLEFKGTLYHTCAYAELANEAKDELNAGINLLETKQAHLPNLVEAFRAGDTDALRQIHRQLCESGDVPADHVLLEDIKLGIELIELITPLLYSDNSEQARQAIETATIEPNFKAALYQYIDNQLTQINQYRASVHELFLATLRSGEVDIKTSKPFMNIEKLQDYIAPLMLADMATLPSLTDEENSHLQTVVDTAAIIQNDLNNTEIKQASDVLENADIGEPYKAALRSHIKIHQLRQDVLFRAAQFSQTRKQAELVDQPARIKGYHNLLVIEYQAQLHRLLNTADSSMENADGYVDIALPQDFQAKLTTSMKRFKKEKFEDLTPREEKLLEEIYQAHSQLKPAAPTHTSATLFVSATSDKTEVPQQEPPATGLFGWNTPFGL